MIRVDFIKSYLNNPKVNAIIIGKDSLSGDCLCTSVKVESVQLALPIIDGASIKPGETITFEVAKFRLKSSVFMPILVVLIANYVLILGSRN